MSFLTTKAAIDSHDQTKRPVQQTCPSPKWTSRFTLHAVQEQQTSGYGHAAMKNSQPSPPESTQSGSSAEDTVQLVKPLTYPTLPAFLGVAVVGLISGKLLPLWAAAAVCALSGVLGGAACVLYVRRNVNPVLREHQHALVALRQVNAALERRVRERTAMLEQSKEQLEENIIEMQKTQRQLMSSSRTAGMAEVASSVLHNIGNALNSVNISSNLALDTLRNSKLKGLGRVNILLEARKSEGPSLLSDAQGQLVVKYLSEVEKECRQEQERLVEELLRLQKNVDRVASIIASQQSAANLGAHIEPFDLLELIEDAIAYHQVSESSQTIEIERDYAGSGIIVSDRQKLFLVLIHLLSNARQSLTSDSYPRPPIVVRTSRSARDVQVSVEDRGEGIPKEALSRIFNLGFTTKNDGRGFGLHNAAIAVSELGGEITAASDGLGRGATFRIRLPLERTQSSSDLHPGASSQSMEQGLRDLA